MADGHIKIDIVGDDKEFQRKLKEIERLEKQKRKVEYKIKIAYEEVGTADDKLLKAQDTLKDFKVEHERLIELKQQYIQEGWGVGLADEMTKKDIDIITGKIQEQQQEVNKLESAWRKKAVVYDHEKNELDIINNKIKMLNAEADKTQMTNMNKSIESVNTNLTKVGGGIKDVIKKVGKWTLSLFGVRSAYMGIRRLMSTLSQFNEQLKTDLSYVGFAIAKTFEPVILKIVQLVYQALQFINSIVGALFSVNLFAKATAEAFQKGNAGVGGMVDNARKLKRELAGFDEMNRLSEGLDGGGGAGGGGGGIISPSVDLSKTNTAFSKIGENLRKVIGDLWTIFKPSWDSFWAGLEPNLMNFAGITGRLFFGLKDIFSNFAIYLKTDFLEAMIESVDINGRVFNGLFDSLNLVFGDIVDTILLPFVNTFTTIIFPLFTDFNLEMQKAFETAFNEVKRIVGDVWTNGIVPVLETIKTIWEDVWVSLDEFWQKWGEPIFKEVSKAFETTGGVLWSLWKDVIEPVWNAIVEVVKSIWKETLKPLLDNIMDMIGELIHGAMRIYNEFIAPIVKWLTETFGPVFGLVFGGIGKVVKEAFKIIGGIIDGITTAFKGIIQFITGVFTGDWDKAWQGVQNIFSGIVKALANIFKVPINSIISLLNLFIRGINKIKIPDWVPGIGGYGFHIQEIQPLAKGGIINYPNRGVSLGSRAIGGEAGAEGVLPFTDAQVMAKMGKEIGKWITNNITIYTQVGSRTVAREIQRIQNQDNFALNGGLL